MKEIKLTQGKIALVCDCHAHLVEGRKWHATKDRNGNWYAKRHTTVIEKLAGASETIGMHAIVNGTPRGEETDHRDRNTLNNQCFNLRTASVSQNGMNRGRRSDNTSGYKGVGWSKVGRRWAAKIETKGQRHHLGYFSVIEDAARAYDRKAIELFGEFATTNFPREDYK